MAQIKTNLQYGVTGTIPTANIADNAITSAKILDGTIVNADVNDLAATKLTGTIADARISASSVTQHVSDTDLTPVRRDINILALRQMITDNTATQGLVNSYIDSFENIDSLSTLTQAGLNANDEALSTIVINGGSGHFVPGYRFWKGTQSTVTTGDFTIEFWYKYIARGAADRLFCIGNSMSGGHGFSSGYNATSTWNVWGGSPALNWNVSYDDIDFTDWHHHAIVRDAGTNIKLFDDGVLKGTSTDSNFYDMNVTGDFWFGRRFNSSGEYFRGYLDSIRFSNNLRYTTNFTPNTVAHSDDANTVFLYEFDTTADPPVDLSGNGHTVTLDTTGGSGYPVRTPTQYKTYTQTNNTTGSVISDTITADTARTKVSGVILYKNKHGTGTLNTDLKIYFSCDNGSNWTQSTMTASQDFSSGIKMAKCPEVTCTSGTQIKFKAEWANQSNGVKETQLYSIGMNY